MSVSSRTSSRLNLLHLEADISAVHLRLARVYIENRPYECIVEHYDRPETFFYLDPPYYGKEQRYGKGIFAPEDFLRIAALLREIKGKFILSINNTGEIRDIFNGFNIREVSTSYSVLYGKHQKVNELLISNY